MTTPEPQSNAAWIDVNRLQAIVNEIAAHFGQEPHKVKGVKLPVASDPFRWSRKEILVAEEGLQAAELDWFRVQAAELYAEASVVRSSPYLKPLRVAIIAFPLALIPIMFAAKSGAPISKDWAALSMFALFVPCAIWLFHRHYRWVDQHLTSEPVLRKLLEVAGDAVRLRKYFASINATGEGLAKFDALVREMGLDQPKPAGT